MSYPNYLNGIPSSLVGYGSQRQQFQSYDGILSTASRVDDENLDTLEKRVTSLDTDVTSLTNKLIQYGITTDESGGLTVGNVTVTKLDAVDTSIGTNTVKTININTNDGTGIVMNNRMIKFRSATDINHIIQWQGDAGSGFDGLEVRGYKGGALGYMQTTANGIVRKACMDWGSERIRSHKTFQAGIMTTGTADGSITFQTEFNTTPVVVASIYGDSSNLLTVTIKSVSTTGFTYKKRYYDGYGSMGLANENFGWIAFDPTNTSLFQ